MADDFVDGNTYAFGKTAVAQWRRLAPVFDGIVVNKGVNIIRCHPNSDGGFNHVKGFNGQTSRFSDAVNVFRFFKSNAMPLKV